MVLLDYRAEGPAAEIKQSVVASTATRLANHATPQPHPQPGAAADFGSATQAGWGCGDMQQRNREKTPDTNVKLNQPLRCGRYGQVSKLSKVCCMWKQPIVDEIQSNHIRDHY